MISSTGLDFLEVVSQDLLEWREQEMQEDCLVTDHTRQGEDRHF